MGRPSVIYDSVCKRCGVAFTRTGRESHGGKAGLTYCSRECHQRSRVPASTPLAIDDAFGHWLAGLVDGEGYFYLGLASNKRARYPVMRLLIEMRDDDRAMLEVIQDTLQMGRIQNIPARHRTAKGANDSARLTIGKRHELLALCNLFEKYPLRSKKQRDAAIWCAAVRHWHQFRDYEHYLNSVSHISLVRRHPSRSESP